MVMVRAWEHWDEVRGLYKSSQQKINLRIKTLPKNSRQIQLSRNTTLRTTLGFFYNNNVKKIKKDGPGPVMVSNTLCHAVQILET